MHITTEFIPNQNNTHVICATSTYGKGLLTSVVHMFCEILGRDCEMYNKKIRNACNKALIELEERAKTKKATGIMDVKFQISSRTVFISGMTYGKENPQLTSNRYDKRESNSNNNTWKCPNCEKINPNYTGTCSCGTSKYDI